MRVLMWKGYQSWKNIVMTEKTPRRKEGKKYSCNSLFVRYNSRMAVTRRQKEIGSLRCDCRLQLELALSKIADEGAGILLYEQQEGRGIGLMAKLKAYELQDAGRDTVEANVELGFEADYREYELPARVLKMLGVTAVKLMTNNPDKVAALESAGITVAERVSAEVEPQETFAAYVRTKQEKMGHIVETMVSDE